MAVILVSGTNEAGSSDITIAAGGAATVFLTDAAGPTVDPSSVAEVQIKAANNEYYKVGQLDSTNNFTQSIASPGTYRVLRRATATNAGFAVEQV